MARSKRRSVVYVVSARDRDGNSGPVLRVYSSKDSAATECARMNRLRSPQAVAIGMFYTYQSFEVAA